jgi:hypothetical protein
LQLLTFHPVHHTAGARTHVTVAQQLSIRSRQSNTRLLLVLPLRLLLLWLLLLPLPVLLLPLPLLLLPLLHTLQHVLFWDQDRTMAAGWGL